MKERRVPTPLPGEKRPAPRLGETHTPRGRFRRNILLLGGFAWRMTLMFVRGRATAERRAFETRVLLERLGGLWTKVGQLLATRPDVFSAELCRELARMQDRATSIPWEEAKALLERELGRPCAEVFDFIEPEPLAAASIGQVHLAAREGKRLAVKIQRPHLAELLRQDMRVIRAGVALIRISRLFSYFRWDEFLWELDQILREEIDYRVEEQSLRRMRNTLASHGIRVPKVKRSLTTQRVLVMEYLEGVYMSEYIELVASGDSAGLAAWLNENDIDPHKVARRLFLSFRRQLFEDNLFHGDLHPGNIMLLRGSRVALIDFGSVGRLEGVFFRKYRLFARAWSRHEYSRAVDILYLMYPSLPDIDLSALKERLVRVVRAWEVRAETRGLPYAEKSFTSCIVELSRILFAARCPLDWTFMRVLRAQSTLDMSLMYLHPDLDQNRALQDYFREWDLRSLYQTADPGHVRRYARQFAERIEHDELTTEQTFLEAESKRRRSLRYH
jgi:ubiquinone biosynthesis protein